MDGVIVGLAVPGALRAQIRPETVPELADKQDMIGHRIVLAVRHGDPERAEIMNSRLDLHDQRFQALFHSEKPVDLD